MRYSSYPGASLSDLGDTHTYTVRHHKASGLMSFPLRRRRFSIKCGLILCWEEQPDSISDLQFSIILSRLLLSFPTN